jgi:hypothetical protein
MEGIPVLRIVFEHPVKAHQLKAFRGAIIQHVGLELENHRFHNHQSDDTYIYQYPLIQYKRVRGRPAILFLGPAVDEVSKLFKQGSRKLYLNGEPYRLSTAQTDSWLWEPAIGSGFFTCVLKHWLPFNDKSFQRYKTLQDPAEQDKMLSDILRGNQLSLAKGLGFWIDATIKTEIIAASPRRPVDVKGTLRQCYDVRFRTNFRLQQWVGLGRHASLGHGTLVRVEPPKPHQQQREAAFETAFTS